MKFAQGTSQNVINENLSNWYSSFNKSGSQSGQDDKVYMGGNPNFNEKTGKFTGSDSYKNFYNVNPPSAQQFKTDYADNLQNYMTINTGGGVKNTNTSANNDFDQNVGNKEDITNEYKLKPQLFDIKSEFTERSDKLDQLKNKFKTMNHPTKPKKTKIKTKRIRRKITLGKNRKGGFIGVLIKNKKTRKNLKKEVDVLKRKSIQEVKEYLRKHNLTKIGSNAPDHILRTTFENAFLSGDVSNQNADILLHNWHKDEDI